MPKHEQPQPTYHYRRSDSVINSFSPQADTSDRIPNAWSDLRNRQLIASRFTVDLSGNQPCADFMLRPAHSFF